MIPDESYQPTIITQMPKTLDDIVIDLTECCEPPIKGERTRLKIDEAR